MTHPLFAPPADHAARLAPDAGGTPSETELLTLVAALIDAARDEAIAREIVAPIEASGVVADAAAAFDLEQIADAVLGTVTSPRYGYAVSTEPEQFWDAVQGADRGGRQ